MKYKIKPIKKHTIIAMLLMALLITVPASITCHAKNGKSNQVTIDDVSTNIADFVKIKDRMYYDPATNIVWLKYTTYGFCDGAVTYIAPDGLPYKYDPDTQTFYTITSEKEAAEKTMKQL